MVSEYLIGFIESHPPLSDVTLPEIAVSVHPLELVSQAIRRVVEQRHTHGPDRTLATLLNVAGAEGWDVVTARSWSRDRTHGWEFVLRRPRE